MRAVFRSINDDSVIEQCEVEHVPRHGEFVYFAQRFPYRFKVEAVVHVVGENLNYVNIVVSQTGDENGNV